MGFEYVAVPWPADAADPQPEMRWELEAAGFTLLGGCALTERGQRAVPRTARSYGDRAEELAEWAVRPSQVFAAPDHSAFAQLAWLWDCRFACFSTVLADGRVLQTMTDWGSVPAWPTQLARHRARTDRHTEQLVLATDRDARVVEGVRGAWDVHRARTSAAREAVPAHERLDDFVALWTAESRVRSRWTGRTRWVAGIMAFLVVLVPFVAVSVALGPQPWWVDTAVVLGAAVLTLPLYIRIWLRVRRWRGLRPRFRAPVPGARS